MSVSVILLFVVTLTVLGVWDRMFAFADTTMHYNLCGRETEVGLEEFSDAPVATVHLQPNHQPRGQCKLKITAPLHHLIYLQWAETNDEYMITDPVEESSPCPLNVFIPENKRIAFWKGDPCSIEPLPVFEISSSQVKIVWSPPRWGNLTRNRQLIVTAVGQGSVCKKGGQHVCMHIGFEPYLCVSKKLVCDGVTNCPKPTISDDEDETLCQSTLKHSVWTKLAAEVLKKFKQQPMSTRMGHNTIEDTTLPPDLNGFNTLDISTKSSKDNKQEGNTDSVSAALSHYGPWGYLMLGMLICGTVLMFCGLWECCFRRPKPSNEALTTRQQPTTVLIVNPPQSETPVQQPPNYDDLDQPPSYAVLFPNNKLQNLETECIERQTIVNVSDAIGRVESSENSNSRESTNNSVGESSRQEVQERSDCERVEYQNDASTSSETPCDNARAVQ